MAEKITVKSKVPNYKTRENCSDQSINQIFHLVGFVRYSKMGQDFFTLKMKLISENLNTVKLKYGKYGVFSKNPLVLEVEGGMCGEKSADLYQAVTFFLGKPSLHI